MEQYPHEKINTLMNSMHRSIRGMTDARGRLCVKVEGWGAGRGSHEVLWYKTFKPFNDLKRLIIFPGVVGWCDGPG